MRASIRIWRKMFPFKMAAAPMGTLPSVSGGTDFLRAHWSSSSPVCTATTGTIVLKPVCCTGQLFSGLGSQNGYES